MKRGEVAATISQGIGPEPVVVCSLGSTSRAWRDVGAPNPTYYASDPMGLGGSMALGLALAVRPRRVLHLAGDGDLMLNLGVLVAIAGAPPCSLAVVVFANRRYETGGGQPLAGGPHTSLAAIAAGAGLAVLPSPSNPLDLLASARYGMAQARTSAWCPSSRNPPRTAVPVNGPGWRSGCASSSSSAGHPGRREHGGAPRPQRGGLRFRAARRGGRSPSRRRACHRRHDHRGGRGLATA